MDNEQIRTTIEHFKGNGENVRVRDIAYTLLSKMFADPKTAYQCLFDGDIEGFDKYSSDPMRESVEDFLTEQGFIKNLSTDDNTGGITFEQNKQAMEQMLLLTKQMAEREGVTEQLKAQDQMLWVQRMNSIRNRVMEIMNHDLIYA